MKPDLHSIEAEPQFQQREFVALPEESMEALPPLNSTSEMEAIRDSAFSEPHLVASQSETDFAKYVLTRRMASSPAVALLCAVLAGVLAGPIAILSAFVGGNPGLTGMFYVIIAGPIVEEIAKQSGLFYLLEKKPYLLIAKWQFPLCAALTAFIFAAIENLLYLNVYAADMTTSSKATLAVVRWTICVAMHVGCALAGSMGLQKVWRETVLVGRPASFSPAAPYIAIAAIIHGLYNCIALSLDRVFF
ncbi:MAG: PrsW family glutamic-type intramembrane protease [Candidatus Sumerlaeaceae bacterium]